MKKPTIVFATVCKNEEHIIKQTLESVYKYISYWVICDTGSTDKTREIITEFFKEKDIPGELFIDEWKGFGPNKTLMMERAKGKADYILHFDADDILIGDFELNEDKYDTYNARVRRGPTDYVSSILYRGSLLWKFCGVAHTIIKCIDKPNFTVGNLVDLNFYLSSEDVGARSFDPEKYLRDAEKLRQQFFDTLVDDPDNLNSRSAFYTAQSYLDSGRLTEAIQWYRLYLRLKNTWIEEEYECYVKIAGCLAVLKESPDKVISEYMSAINIFPDRAEAHYRLGQYCNTVNHFQMAYDQLDKAYKCDLEKVKSKYILFIDKRCYGKFVKDELSVACYWLERYNEGLKLINEIVDDPDFELEKPRLLENIQHFKNKLS
jgi:glycosyltransferase involved in cell wall biosynthesis